MRTNKISLLRITCFLIILLVVGYLLIIGKPILTPLAFGALFAFMLKPVASFFEKLVKWRIPAIALTMLSVAIPVVVVIGLFSSQLISVFNDMPSIEEKLDDGVKSIEKKLRKTFDLSRKEATELMDEQTAKLVEKPFSFLGGGLVTSTSFITGFLLTGIYVFLFLLYRSAFKNFILIQSSEPRRAGVGKFLSKIQTVIQKYLYGLLLVMLILGTLNSVGLWAIGLRHAMFWGFLAALLAVIPYVGTFIGGLLPFIYALAAADHSWQPLAVVILFIIVQTLEGNFISPKVVGSSVKVNPLAAIVAVLLGNELWGIAGMVLALPAVAVLKELMKQVDFLRPVSLLMSDDLMDKEDAFVERLDKEEFRFRNFFKK